MPAAKLNELIGPVVQQNQASGVLGVENPERPIDERAGFYGSPSDGGSDLGARKDVPTIASGLIDRNTSGLLAAIQQQESGGTQNPHTVIGDGGAALGAFQMHNPAARQAATELGLPYDPSMRANPEIAPQLAQQYLSDLFNYTGSVPGAIAAYQMGPGAYKAAVNAGQDPTQGDYTKNVLRTGLVNPDAGVMPPGPAPSPPSNPEYSKGLADIQAGQNVPGVGAANEGHGGKDQTRDTSGDRTVYSSPIGPGLTDKIDSGESDHVAGVKEESQAEHNENRGGRIHKYAAGGYAPISMQYGLPTQEDLAQKYSDFAGTGVGQLGAQELAMAAKGILPAAAKGGRIGYANLPDGSGAVKSDDDYSLAGNPDLNSNSMWSEDTDTSYLPIEKEDPDIFKRISRALYPKGPLSMAVGSSAKYTMPDAGLRIGKEGQPAITTVPVNEEDMDRAYKVGKTVQQRMAESPSDVAKRVTDELAARPTSASGTYTQSYDVYPNRPDEGGGSIKTSPIIPKSTDNGPDSVVSKFLTTDDEIPSSSTTQSAPTTRKKGVEVAQDTTRTQSDAPQPGFGYVAPNPADMRNFYGLTYGLSLLSGSSIAAAGDTYAKNILAQQAEQRAQMEAQGRTAQSYGSAESSQATAGKTRAEETNMLIKPSFFGDYALVLSPNPENPSFKTIPMPGMDQSQIPAPSTGLGDAADSALDQYSKDFKRTNGARFLLKPDDAVNYKNDFMQEQKELSKAAGAANSSLGDVRTMAEALTEAGGSPVGMGAGARYANSLRRQAYGLARAFGYNGPEPGDDPVIAQQELDKISQFLANAQVGAITHNGAARLVEANRSVQPNVDLEFGTASRLFSGTARQNVMLRDYQKVLNAYGKRTANTGTDVQQVYQDAMPADRYNREQAVLESLVQPNMTVKDNDGKSQNLVTRLLNNKITKNQFDAIISQKYPDLKNLSRWLVN